MSTCVSRVSFHILIFHPVSPEYNSFSDDKHVQFGCEELRILAAFRYHTPRRGY